MAAGDFLVTGDADFVRHAVGRQLLLGLADHRDLGNREQPVGQVFAHLKWLAEGVANGSTPLLHRHAGQRRESDDVSHAVDVGNPGLMVFVAPEPAAFVRLEPGGLQVEVGVSPTRPTVNRTVSPTSRLPLSSWTKTIPCGSF